jgi:hypothetical protein
VCCHPATPQAPPAAAGLPALFDDVLVYIGAFLDIQTLLHLRSTCRAMRARIVLDAATYARAMTIASGAPLVASADAAVDAAAFVKQWMTSERALKAAAKAPLQFDPFAGMVADEAAAAATVPPFRNAVQGRAELLDESSHDYSTDEGALIQSVRDYHHGYVVSMTHRYDEVALFDLDTPMREGVLDQAAEQVAVPGFLREMLEGDDDPDHESTPNFMSHELADREYGEALSAQAVFKSRPALHGAARQFLRDRAALYRAGQRVVPALTTLLQATSSVPELEGPCWCCGAQLLI